MRKIGELLQQTSYKAQSSTLDWKTFVQSIRRKRGGACENCKRTDVETQVHHLSYDPKLKPWEQNEDDVVLLCAACRSALNEELSKFRRFVFRNLRPEHFRVLNGALTVGLTHSEPVEFVHAVAEMASSPSSIRRFAYVWKSDKPKS